MAAPVTAEAGNAFPVWQETAGSHDNTGLRAKSEHNAGLVIHSQALILWKGIQDY